MICLYLLKNLILAGMDALRCSGGFDSCLVLSNRNLTKVLEGDMVAIHQKVVRAIIRGEVSDVL
ncbi:hypothetical protein KDH_10090 [Dictyobacter sp. S3.2.2.5]|uniref:Uncharacterized protein n=1 Tax=Dictyobacter halimunensis TaxID=3026934 RepID=A0ABQ6FKJ2_9CHLR|nr:hypothetical protein KDH_10090 [Dictyobacter sp. S3.2.2.5]